ncbi:MAG: 4Fe-4S binding protein [Methanomassiliicoccaceae archaeon]|nr:4Fe-4S binding protein [Methanomassiliicoccaceae archaeon]
MKDTDKMTNELDSGTVKGYGSAAGAAVVGIASSNDFGSAPEGLRPSDNLEGCLSVIVLGHPFPKEALLDPSADYIGIRNEISKKLTDIAKEVEKKIKGKGYKAKAIGGLSGKWVNGKQYGLISLKHAAELAGLGIIGRNYLLINPEYGTLLWFSAVLTDAYLVPDERSQYTFCDGCNKCVEMCPSKALDDPSSFGRNVCTETMFKMVNKKWAIKCFLCRKVCPYSFGEPAES